MKRVYRPSSTGSTAAVHTSTSTLSSKPVSGRTSSSVESKPVGQQTTVYLNSLELQAALSQQQTQIAKAEFQQLQSHLKSLATSLTFMKHQHDLNEALVIKQESELASLKLTAAFIASQNLPKRLEDSRKAVDDLITEFRQLVSERNTSLGVKDRVSDTGEDRVAALIVGQIDMYETRLEQKEQEIRILNNRFQRELSFLREEQELLRKQTRDEIDMRKIEVRKTLKLQRKERLLSPASPKTVSKKRSMRSPKISL